jgi:hypothetical protein
MADKNFKIKTGLDLPAPLPVAQGGTGQNSLSNVLNALLPLQTGNSGKVLSTDGTNTLWGGDVSGVSTTGGSTITVSSGSTVPLTIQNNGTGNSFIVNDVASDTTPFIIGADGLILAGSSTAYNSVGAYQPGVSNFGQSGTIGQYRYSADTAGTELTFNKSRSATLGTHTAVASGDAISILRFAGSDGTSFTEAVRIIGAVDGTVSTGVIPGRIVFNTASSAGTLTERMRIDSAGRVGIGATPGTTTFLSLAGTPISTSGNLNIARAFPTISSAITGTVVIYDSVPTTQAAAFTVSELNHFRATPTTIGASSAITVEIGYRSTINSATGNYALYFDGTARSYFGGNVGIGMAATVPLDVTGTNVRLTPTNVVTNGFVFNGSSGNALWATMQSYKTLIDGVSRFEVLGSGITGIGAASGAAQLLVTSTSTTNPVLIVKGAASQTGDLFQIQDSAATVLARFNSSGQLGIGGIPGSPLDVINTGANNVNARVRNSAGISDLYTLASGDTHLVNQTTGKALTFGTQATERMRIDSAGNVGIGTTSPIAPLHLAGTSSPMMVFDYYGANANSSLFLGRKARGTIASPTAILSGDSITAVAARGYGATAYAGSSNGLIGFFAAENFTDTAQGTYITFENATTGTTTRTERMRIDSAGNVGIGIASPQADLHIGSSTTVSDMRMGNSAASTVLNMYTASNDVVMNVVPATGTLQLGTNNTERMRITAAGSVGIGTGSPGANLHVVGQLGTQSNSQTIPTPDNGTVPVFLVAGNFSNGGGETNFWNTASGLYGGFRFSQVTGSGTYNDVAWFAKTSINLYTSNTERIKIDANGITSFQSALLEKAALSATAATGTIIHDVITNGPALYYTSAATGNWIFNVRGNSGTTLNSFMAVGQSMTVVFLNTNTGTAYYPTSFQIDGVAVVPKWQGGSAPGAGNVNSIDSYSYTIIKTAASTYTVLASQTRFS